jgi:hypothetical protein
MKSRVVSRYCLIMPGLLGGSRRRGAVLADDRAQAVVFYRSCPYRSPAKGADEDSWENRFPTPTPAKARRHLPRKRVPTPQLPECGLRDNLPTHPRFFAVAAIFSEWSSWSQMLARRNGRERIGPR